MVLPASDIVLPTPKNSTRETVEIYDELDICTTAEHFHDLKFMATEDPKIFAGKESPQKEKHMSVDATSLRESSLREASFNLMLPPVVATPDLLPPLLPAKPQHISCSLPNSASSSPRFSFALLKKRWKNESQASPRQIDNLALRHSAEKSNLTVEQEIHFRRSKSCAEGRSTAPADELDLWFSKPNSVKSDKSHHGNFSKTEANKDDHRKTGKTVNLNDDGFKCGALCLYLPGFAKAKPGRPKKEEIKAEMGQVISRTVSLEKFECGSWASSAIINDHEEGGFTNLYFDLPLELIRTSVSDANSPVSAAFVFDNDRKGVLKNSSTRATPRKSHESPRHVRFSTSSPTSYPASPASCITPRLRKAREDFNAFLEAQNA